MRAASKFCVLTVISLFLMLTFAVLACAPAAPSVGQIAAVNPPATPPIMVMTVLGPIAPEKLGVTLVHEHFTSTASAIAPENRAVVLEACLKACDTLKSVGIQSVINASPIDTGGRDPLLLKELSTKSGINIICCTGFYREGAASEAYWGDRKITAADTKMLSELFIKEITQGIGDTGVKAGAIKVGSSSEMTDYERVVHEAAAIAQKATGVPIITHTDGPTGGPEQADFLISKGADPKKVQIGHVNNSKDINYQRSVLTRGTKVAFDRLGCSIAFGVPDDITVQNIAALIKEGYVNQIELSQDTINNPIDISEESMSFFKDWRLDHISKDIIPALKAQGVTDEQIKIMMVDNPKNLFLGK